MGKFVVENELVDAIKSVVNSSRADLAVAFWGDKACDLIDMPLEAQSVRVACDAFSGACNPSAIRELLDRGAHVVDVPGLHAKVYIGADEMIVTSANASANGLGEGTGELDLGLEAGYTTRARSDISNARHWFNNVFESGVRVSESDLMELAQLWDARREARPKRNASRRTFLQMLTERPEWFLNRSGRVVCCTTSAIPASAIEKYKSSPFYDEATYESSEVPFYWGTEEWTEKSGRLILDFAEDSGKLSSSGFWRVLGVIDNGSIVACEKETHPYGMKFSAKDKAKLSKIATKVFLSGKFDIGTPIDLFDFTEGLRS